MCYAPCVLHVYNVVRAEHVSVSLFCSNVFVVGSVTNLKLARYNPWGMVRGIVEA